MKFAEKDGRVMISVRKTNTGRDQLFSCRKLVLGAGTLGTARIVMRSFDYKAEKLPILCNDYCYLPCFQLDWGKRVDEHKNSYSQLVLFHDKNKINFDVAMIIIYTYRSLMLFRAANDLPFGLANNVRLLSKLYPFLTIACLHHPEKRSENKYIRLVPDVNSKTGDRLFAEYHQTTEEKLENESRENEVKKALRKLKCYPIKKIKMNHGASIHYAGTLPFSDKNELFRLSPNGKLGGTKNVYVADGSGFRYLPAKAPTLTFMANAHIVALNALKNE